MNFFKPVKTGRSVPNIFIGSECSKSSALKVSASDPVKDGVLRCGDVGGVGHPVGQTHSLPGLAGWRMGCQRCYSVSGVTPNSY